MNPQEWNQQIQPYDGSAAMACEDRWNSIAKPLHSLGQLEQAVIQIAGLTGDARYSIGRRAVLVLCADNGVVRQGVAQTGSEVTAAVARNLTLGDASVCRMAAVARADVIPVDMGMLEDPGIPELLNRRVAAGTGDISAGPAMTTEQALFALQQGINLVRLMKGKGYRILATGEMGIGNTTTSSAVVSVLLGMEPSQVTGRGAGLSSEGLQRKTEVIRQAIRVNQPHPSDALDVLSKLGGFDIAGLAGIFIGGAIYRVPVLIDGVISASAALVARKLCPESAQCMLASHISAEPAAGLVLEAMGLKPIICAGMFLGEGSGAVAALPLLDMAYAVYEGMRTFEEVHIDSYQPLD